MPVRNDAWEAQLPAETAKELYRLTKCPTEEEAKAGRIDAISIIEFINSIAIWFPNLGIYSACLVLKSN